MRAQPFASFFLLASLDAMISIGVLAPLFWEVPSVAGDGSAVLGWHARELLFGYVPAVLAGFFLTALPRWTGKELSQNHGPVLLGLWLAARLTPWLPIAGPAPFVAPVAYTAGLISSHVVAARDRRDFKVLPPLWLLAAASGVVAISPADPAWMAFGCRLGLAATLVLIMIIGGRVVPSLTERYCVLHGKRGPMPSSPRVEAWAAFGGAAGLTAWTLDPTDPFMGFTGGVAAIAQFLRLMRWRGWIVIRVPSLAVLHVAYAFIPLGFALSAAAPWVPQWTPAVAGLHAWSAGALGCMTLAIMASMIRRRTGQSFASSRTGTLALILVVLAAATRIVGALSASPVFWQLCSAVFWICAFALFLFDFRRTLLAPALALIRRQGVAGGERS